MKRAAARDLRDCRISDLSADWRFNIAYNAALRMATAALAASGYRASRDQHHFRVIHSLEFTVRADLGLIGLFDQFRKKRNIGTYEHPGAVSEHEVDQVLHLAEKVRDMVDAWLGTEHPELL